MVFIKRNQHKGVFLSANEGCAGVISGACLGQCLLEYKTRDKSPRNKSSTGLTSKPGSLILL